MVTGPSFIRGTNVAFPADQASFRPLVLVSPERNRYLSGSERIN